MRYTALVRSDDAQPTSPIFRPFPRAFQPSVDLDLQTKLKQLEKIHLRKKNLHYCPA